MQYIDQVLLKSPPPQRSYLSNIPAVRHLAESGGLTFSSPVTFLVGENGTGKSTLLEAIAVAYGFNPEGGTKNFAFSTKATHSALYQYLKLVRSRFPKDGFFFRAESFYNVASYIDELDEIPAASAPVSDSYGGRSLHVQSHGESFLALVQNRFSGKGLYILDEPEAALSPSRQLTLLNEIHRLVRLDSQFIIATHAPILMAYPGAEIYQLTHDSVSVVPYQETEHYRLTRDFLTRPEHILSYLLDEPDLMRQS